MEGNTCCCSCCKLSSDQDVLVHCCACNRSYHTYCMTGCDCCGKVPNRQFKKVAGVPEGDWYCKHCRDHIPALAAGENPKSLMYGWGDNTHGCLGSQLKKELYSVPQELKEVEGVSVEDFAAGESFSILCTRSGDVYTCGNGTNGCLGHQDVVHEDLNQFRLVDFFKSGKISKGEGKVDQVNCVCENVNVVTQGGHMYGWGENQSGELGHMDAKPKRLPKKNSAFRELKLGVKEIVSGDHHSLLLTEEGSVYAMGENTLRQLGVSNNSMEWTPKILCAEWKHDRSIIKEPDFPRTVIQIYAGGNSSMCCDKKGVWYIWGADILKNCEDALGKSPLSFASSQPYIPYPVITPMFDGIQVADVAIGAAHYLVLDEEGCVYSAGDNTSGQLGRPGGFSQKFEKVNVPAGMIGVFAEGNVSGCYGETGLYMWGDYESPLMVHSAPLTGNVIAPTKVEGISNVLCVKTSYTHILIECQVEAETRKRDAEEEEEGKRVKVDA